MENRERLRAEVVRKLNDWDSDNHQNTKFLLKIGDCCIKEVMSYIKVYDRIEAIIKTEQIDNISIFISKKV